MLIADSQNYRLKVDLVCSINVTCLIAPSKCTIYQTECRWRREEKLPQEICKNIGEEKNYQDDFMPLTESPLKL